MTKKMLDQAYDLDGADATKTFYNSWADTYDAELSENGYSTPVRCAQALGEFVADKSALMLDIGCGTGVSGLALEAEGFTALEGCDFSEKMLRQAKAKNIYAVLHNTNLENPFPFEQGAYQNISAIGVLNPGHAPASTLDDALNLLNPGGHFVMSLNDHALADNSYEARINDHVDSGSAMLMFKEYGDHLPKMDLKSNVYVLRKL